YNLNERMWKNDSKKFSTGTQYENATKEKIRNILKTAILTGHDAIVLSAFGCGAFRNNPEAVSRLFHEVLSERVDTTGAPGKMDVGPLKRQNYKDVIKVVFAIKGGGSNLTEFQKRFV
ncbi:MAG: hypothetical protein K1000chlam1_01054, partial [Candidatus Anoxychlamydiales bacterium]|nr:hypothetical protein [Candidatus Anoxychlamydiales bacterium]